MIRGTHAILYAKDADRTRRFFREVLGLRSVDAGDGWLIFALPPAEIGIHPDDEGGRHELYLMCDDVHGTVEELEAKGVRFTEPVADRGWGLLTALEVPGGGTIGLYEPRHPTAIPWAKARGAKKGGGRKARKTAAPKRKPAAKRRAVAVRARR